MEVVGTPTAELLKKICSEHVSEGATERWSQTTGHRPMVTDRQSPTADHRPPVTDH